MNELRISTADLALLQAHLFPGDRDEHAAVLLCGLRRSARNSLLLAVREVHPLQPAEFPPGEHGYRQLAASALARLGNRAAREGLALVSVHSHPGSHERTALSPDDLAAHARVFPHMLDITGAAAVGGIAFGERSAAGEIWHRDLERVALDRVRVVGASMLVLTPAPAAGVAARYDERFDRQVRLFGAEGQARLDALHVGVVGAGGGGSILVEQLAHLGVGRLTVVDHDVVKTHNLSRIMAATAEDARAGTKKVDVAARSVERIDPSIDVNPIDGDIADLDVAARLVDCDFLFLATDTVTARLVANAIAQTFLVPLVQIGAKVDSRDDGSIEQIYTAVRPVLPRRGCLQCAGLIDPVLLQREAASSEERSNQNYLGSADVIDPSVTTLNAAAAAAGLNVFLMNVMGLAENELAEHRITLTRDGSTFAPRVEVKAACRWCGTESSSRYARADLALLPCRPGLKGADEPEKFAVSAWRARFAAALRARLRHGRTA